MFELISHGKNLEEIDEEMCKDPKTNMRCVSDPGHVVNQKNMTGETPLYVACKHGYLEIVDFLISKGADPHIKSKVSKKQEESVLDVATRWNHIKIVEKLIDSIEWTRAETKSAYRLHAKTQAL